MFENKARCLRMYVSCFWLTALLTTTSLVTSARQQEATNPQTVSNIDIQTLIRESDRNGRKEFSRYRDHTYKVRQIRRVRGGDGKVKEESWVYEMIFPDSKHLIKKHVRVHQILIEENSKAIPSERLAKEREKFGKRLEKVESQAEEGVLEIPQGKPWMVFGICSEEHRCMKFYGSDVLEQCEFSLPRSEMMKGREMIALQFRPRSDAAFAEDARYMHQIEGKIWIDALERVVSRLAVWPKGTKFDDESSDYLLENAAIAIDWERTKEGAWLLKHTRINALRYPSLFLGIEVDYMTNIYDYLYFKVEVGKERLNDP